MDTKRLLLLLVPLLLFASANAILQTHSYDEATKTATISDWFGLSKVMEVKLVDNSDICLIDCYSVLNITAYKDITTNTKDYALMAKSVTNKEASINTKISVLTTAREIKTPIFEDCIVKQIDNITEKTTEIKSRCDTGKVETTYKDYSYWKETDFSKLEFKDGQTYTIKIEAKKPINKAVDFIPTLYSEQINEWVWWNAGWLYKQQFNVSTSSGTTPAPYQVGLNITYTGNMQADFDDLRFINGTETTELDYWIENKSNSNWAYIWVESPYNLSAANTTFYMYYGNAGATTTADLNNTFDGNGDNFTRANSQTVNNGWTEVEIANSNISISDNKLKLIGPSAGATLARVYKTYTLTAGTTNYSLGGLVNISQTNQDEVQFARMTDGANNDINLMRGHGDGHIYTLQPVVNFVDSGVSYSANVNYRWRIDYDATDGKVMYWFNNANITNWVLPYTANVPTLMEHDYYASPGTYYIGYDYLRPLAQVEPTGSFGIEIPASGLSVSPNAPADAIVFNDTTTIDFNFTAVSTSDLSFLCDLYINGTLEGTEPATANNTLTNFNVVGLSYGSHNWLVNCIDSTMSVNSTIRTFSIVDATFPTSTLVSPSGVVVSNSTTLNFTCTSTDNIQLKNATLYWDYAGWASNGTETITGVANSTTFTRTVNFTAVNPLTWNCEICDNSSNCAFAPANYSVAAFFITVSAAACPGGWVAAQNYTIVDENNITNPVTSDVTLNLRYGDISNPYVDTYNGTLSGVTSFNICVIPSLAPYYIGYGEIQHVGTNYVDRRYYLWTNSTLTNVTEYKYLYNLQYSNTTSYSQSWTIGNATNSQTNTTTAQQSSTQYATSFYFVFTDMALNKYSGFYAELLRWYPALDSYNNVEMSKTDSNGQGLMRLVTENVDYKVGLFYTNGTLVKLSDPTRLSCQTYPCTYTMRIDSLDTSYLIKWGYQVALTWNNATKFYTFTWNDPASSGHNLTFTTYKDTGSNSIVVCNQTSAVATGTMSCNMSLYATSGQLRAEVWRSSADHSPMITRTDDVTSSVFTGALGMLIAFIIFMTLALIGTFAPEAAIILSVIGLIPAVALHVLTLTIAFLFAVMGVVAIHLLKRVS